MMRLFIKYLTVSLLILQSGFAAFPEFEYHTIDRIGAVMGHTGLADVDNDGDLDWIVGEAPWFNSSRTWWWEYQGPDTWVRHDMGTANSDVGGNSCDVNGDGWADHLAGARLFINRKDGTFSSHDAGTIFSHDTEFGDVNGDGKMDAIASHESNGLVWYDIPADAESRWTSHSIAASAFHKIHGGISPRGWGDMDGDGDNDIVTGEAWYENTDGAGTGWRQHKNINFGEYHQYGLAVKTWVLDLDGDGDNDFIQSEADNPDSRLAWFENDGSGNWIRHIIKDKGDRQDLHSLAVADFDLDGDMDIFTGGGPMTAAGRHKSLIFENLAGASRNPGGSLWKEHLITEKPTHEAVAADVDGDGDIDICTKPWTTGNEHIYFRNMAVENGIVTRQSNGFPPIRAADLTLGRGTAEFSLQAPGMTVIELLGTNGRLTTRLFHGVSNKGLNTVPVNVPEIPDGRYILILRRNGSIMNSTRFIISRGSPQE